MSIFRWPFFTYGSCKVPVKVFKTETLICLLPQKGKTQWEEENVYAEVTTISARYKNVFWETIFIKLLLQHVIINSLLTFSLITMPNNKLDVTMGTHTGRGRECTSQVCVLPLGIFQILPTKLLYLALSCIMSFTLWRQIFISWLNVWELFLQFCL